ncbi:unnamed protein product [Brassica rapa subsp. trilocularis]
MSHLLLSRLSDLSFRRHSLLHKTIRLFSSSSTSPCFPLCVEEKDSPGDGGMVGDVHLFDAATEGLVTVADKTIPEEIVNGGIVVGASHGWLFFKDRHDHSVYVTDFYNSLAFKTNATMVPMPTFTALHHCQTEVVWNVAMSTSPGQQEDEDDWVVGIKFLGNQLSFCRPRRDLRWTNVSAPFKIFNNSNLMFSKRDKTFKLPAPVGNYLCSWDIQFHKDEYPAPKIHKLLFHNLPQLPLSMWELLDSCPREDHWVESPSGESFLVKWYSRVSLSPSLSTLPIVMVFREEDRKDGIIKMCYTEDIGDICIFLSKSEAFCVPASSCPGLKPNSIYVADRVFSVYDLTTKTFHHFKYPIDAPEKISRVPCWLPPVSV